MEIYRSFLAEMWDFFAKRLRKQSTVIVSFYFLFYFIFNFGFFLHFFSLPLPLPSSLSSFLSSFLPFFLSSFLPFFPFPSSFFLSSPSLLLSFSLLHSSTLPLSFFPLILSSFFFRNGFLDPLDFQISWNWKLVSDFQTWV